MLFENDLCRSFIENMINAFSFCRIITDDSGLPVDGEFIYVNPAFEKFTGLRREFLLGHSIREAIPDTGDDGSLWIAAYGNIALNEGAGEFEQYCKALDKWFRVFAYSPQHGYFSTVFDDITELKMKEAELESRNEELKKTNLTLKQLYDELSASEQELRQNLEQLKEAKNQLEQSEELYHLIADSSINAIWYWDVTRGDRIYSDKISDVLSYQDGEIHMLENLRVLVHPDDLCEVDGLFRRQADKKLSTGKIEFRIRCKNGQYKWVRSSYRIVYDKRGKPARIAGSFSDITALKDNREIIEHLAYHDSLTDLPNRMLFMDRLGIALKLAARNNWKAAVLFVDLDNYKVVNDTYGHPAGDHMLRLVAMRMAGVVRGSETIARIGGDEFSILLQNVKNEDEVLEFAERIRKILQEPFILEGRSFSLGASIGASIYPGNGSTPEELLKNADAAMYKAKLFGKNNCQFFDSDLREEMKKKAFMEKQLGKALERGELVLYYQPQFDIKTGEIRSFEALLRWNSAELGIISPAEFIPIAEETGHILSIGEWVLYQACSRIAEWNKSFGKELKISVNISIIQLKDSLFEEVVERILRKTGLEPRLLELELAERMIMQISGPILETLENIKNLGVRLSLDDFGSGYSSLNALKRLPISTLKLDKCFVHDIDLSPEDVVFTGAIIDMVHKLKLEVVAEGVETQTQLNCLDGFRCESAQGFLLSRPAEASKAVETLRNNYSDSYIMDKLGCVKFRQRIQASRMKMP